MEHQQIIPLLNESNDFKFVPRKWNIVNEQSKAIRTLSKINRYQNLIFVISMMLAF